MKYSPEELRQRSAIRATEWNRANRERRHEMTREEFLAARKSGLGGSDAASVFNVGWGCRRRLFYEKRNTAPDYPREETSVMELGSYLEPFIAEKYTKATGRTVDVAPHSFVHPEYPELRVNADRILFKPGTSTNAGVLEIKAQGRAAFYASKRNGLSEDYILQLQWGMLVTGSKWGSFAIMSRDSGELIHWDVDRNETICNEILTEGPLFWAQVQNGPMPEALEPDDPRCGKCEYRVTCQGNALIQIETGEMPQVQELAPLVEEYIQRKAICAEAESLVDETAEELKTRLGDKQAVYAGEHKVYFRPSAGRTTYKSEELLKSYREACRKIEVLTQVDPTKMDLPPADTFVGKSKPSRPLRIF